MNSYLDQQSACDIVSSIAFNNTAHLDGGETAPTLCCVQSAGVQGCVSRLSNVALQPAVGAVLAQAVANIATSEMYSNRAGRGGVLFVSGRADQAGRGTSQASRYHDNRANGDGGVLWLSSASSFVSQNNVYTGNMAIQGCERILYNWVWRPRCGCSAADRTRFLCACRLEHTVGPFTRSNESATA